MEQLNNEQLRNNTFIYNYREALNMQLNNHANNIANSMTTGYKLTSSYIDSKKTQSGEFRYSVIDRIDFAQGTFKETKKEFDYAIKGDGFFALRCEEQLKYTRAGMFELDKEGYIRSPLNSCYLLGQLYSDDNQEQITKVDKLDLTPIKIDKGSIKGKATTNADVALNLSAKQMALGGGNGELTIDTSAPGTWNDGDKFSITFYQKKGDEPTKEHKYNFVYSTGISGFDANTKTITFNDRDTLIAQVKGNLDQFIDFAGDQTDTSKIKFVVKSSSGNSNYFGGVNAGARVNANIQGEISETKNEFDYAIEGEGFFTVKCADHQLYTRAGRFEIDKEGYIKSSNGCYLLGELYPDNNQEQIINIDKLEPIKLDKSPLVRTSIDDKGNYANGEQKKLASIPVAKFKNPLKLEKEFGTIAKLR